MLEGAAELRPGNIARVAANNTRSSAKDLGLKEPAQKFMIPVMQTKAEGMRALIQGGLAGGHRGTSERNLPKQLCEVVVCSFLGRDFGQYGS